jgi:S1-C subfamily serine protease
MLDDNIFNFLIYDNGKLAYSKYNFNFQKFQNFIGDLDNLSSRKKISLFANFLKLNGTILNTPFSINNIYKKYFDPITEEIRLYVSKYGVLHPLILNSVNTNYDINFIEEHQFDLYPYPESMRIQNFVYSHNNYEYNKYNFNFNKYMQDWIISDNKLVAFTDFIFRNYKLIKYSEYTNDSNDSNDNLNNNYIILPQFQQYFIPITQELMNYIMSYSVYSYLLTLDTIDFLQYLMLNTDLSHFTSINLAKEHFLSFGQFEQRILKFKDNILLPIQNAKKGIGSIFIKIGNDSSSATGFLFKQNNNIYLVTVYHLISDYSDKRYLYAIFENDSINNFVAQFKIIGYDKATDILIGYYDDKLNYNQLSNIDFTKQIFLNIDYSYKILPGEVVYLIGNIGFNNNLSTIQTIVMNNNYSIGSNIEYINETIPSSLLLQYNTKYIPSGAPILQGNPNGNKTLNIIGMLIGSLYKGENGGEKGGETLIAIDNYILLNIIYQIIKKWNLFLLYNLSNIHDENKYDNYNNKNDYTKTWLGISSQYNHPILISTYKELTNLNYIGGLLVTNFIIGFNFRDEKFVYTNRDLVDRNVIQLQSPLLNTLMYKNFISNSNIPLVIKSITYYDGIQNKNVKLYVGKFGNQQSYTRFVYAKNYIIPFNTNILEFQSITIEYYYYKGKQWILTTEQINDNSNSSYVDYSDNNGNTYHQHKFEYPIILLPYFSNYLINKCNEDHTN